MPRNPIQKLVDFHEGESVPALLSALYFFCLLFGYFMLRPLRDAMGLDDGVDSLHKLFLITLGVMVIANIAYGFVASRVPRRVFVPIVYWIGVACIAGFLAAFLALGEHRSPFVGKVFYVWLSVFNLFAVTVFWGFMADLFTLAQSKRLFGFIGVGGTAGAMCGSAFTGVLAVRLGEAGLFACAAALIAIAGAIATALARRADARTGTRIGGLRGASWSGLVAIARSPYLMGIAAYVALFTILSTLIYFEKGRIVYAATDDREARAQILAWIEMGGQALTLFIQVFLTGRLMRRLGVGTLLALVPLLTLAGFIALAVIPGLLTIALLDAARRACNHALSKPARETLFTVVPREDKYKAKSAIDTFVYRGGDSIGTLLDMWRTHSAAIAASGGLLLAAPLCLAGVALSFFLGQQEKRRAASTDQTDHAPPFPAPQPLSDAPTPVLGSANA
ncbi:MAG: NTP/NDP exchange transporter [Phycisphaerales bacterium]